MNAHDGRPVIVFYDGVCGLCDRLVQFLLKRDTQDQFRFAALQSPVASVVLGRHGADPAELNTLYVALNMNESDERILNRSDAALHILRRLGGVWGAFARVGRAFPRVLRDAVYNTIARNRYRLFGQVEHCTIPNARDLEKFLDRPM